MLVSHSNPPDFLKAFVSLKVLKLLKNEDLSQEAPHKFMFIFSLRLKQPHLLLDNDNTFPKAILK